MKSSCANDSMLRSVPPGPPMLTVDPASEVFLIAASEVGITSALTSIASRLKPSRCGVTIIRVALPSSEK